MRYFLALLLLGSVGCANVSTTRFEYSNPEGTKVVVEMPKEIDARDLSITIDAQSGNATITAKEWSTRNAGTIEAQANREGQLLEKVAKGAAEGAVKAIIPIP